MNFAKRSICNYCGKKRVIGIKEASLSLGANGDSRSLGPSTPYSDSTKPFMRVQVKAEPKQADTEPWECGCGNINAAECPTCLGCKEPKRRTQEPARDAGRGKFEMLQEPARDAGRGKFEMLQEPARDAGRGKFEMLQEPARDAGRGRFEMLQEPARGASRGRFETSQDDSIRKRAREAGREMNDISLDTEMQERGRAAGRGTNVPHADVPARSFERIRQGSKEAQVSRADRNAGGNYGAGRGMDIPPANKAPASKPPSLMEGMVARSELAAVPPGYWTCGQCQRVNYAGKIMCDKCCAPRENADLVIAEVEAGRQYSDSNRSLLLKFFPNGEDMSRPISDLIILEQMEWSKSAFMALDESAARAGLLVEWEYKEVVNMVSCKLYIQKRLVSSSSKSSRNQAQDEAALAALADLYKTNKVIQVRPQEDSNIWYTWQSIQRGARNSPIPSIEDLISIAGFVSNSVDVAGVSTLLNQPIKSSKETLFACHIMLAHFTDFSGRLQDCIFHPSLPEHVRKFLMNFSTKLKLNCRIGSIHDEPDTTYPCFYINVSFSEIVSVLEQGTTEVGKYHLLKMGTKQFASLLGVPGFDTVKQIDPSVTSPISSQTPAFESRDFKPVADDNMRPVMDDGQSIDDFTGSNKDNSGLRNDGANSTETSNQTPEMKKSEKTKKIKLMKGSWSNREQMHSDVDVSRSVLDLIVLEPEDLSEARDQNAFTILTASCTRNDMLVEWTLDPTDSGHRCQVYIQTELYADQLSKEWQDARRLAFGEAMLKVYKSNPVIVKMKTKLEDVKWTWEKLQSFADQWNPDVKEIVSVPSRTEYGILQNARAVSFACCTLKRQMNDRSLKFENECTFTKMPDADMFYVKDFAQELGYMVKIKKQRGNYILITTRRISLTELVNELINSPSGCLGRYRMLKQIEIDDYSSKQQYEASDGQGSGDMDWEYV